MTNIDDDGYTNPLHMLLIAAARAGDAAECSRLMAIGADPKARSSAALHLAAGRGHADCLRLLIPVSAPKSNDSEALYIAAANGQAESVRLLIPVSEPKDRRSRALLVSAQRGHAECAKLLLPASESLAQNCLPLQAAIRRGHAAILSAMLDHEPSSLDALKKMGLSTLLSHAISLGHMDVAARLSSIIDRQAIASTLPDLESPSCGSLRARL